jgi:hypothetical protein
LRPFLCLCVFFATLSVLLACASSPPQAAAPSRAPHALNQPVIASAMEGDLEALDLDLASLPPLKDLPPVTLRKVMKTFTRSLGASCTDCHVENDYAAPTERKRVATFMWDRFVRAYGLKKGSDAAPLYCDSCHHGALGDKSAPLLDRHDEIALAHWMEDNLTHGLVRRNGGAAIDCTTCHGDPFDGHFLRRTP